MPIRTSGSFRRYFAAAPRIGPAQEAFYERLRERRFKAIDDQPVGGPSCGWVVSGTFSSSDFRPDTVLFGKVVRLGLRVDQKRLPANAVRVRLMEAVRDLGGKVARAARTRLKDEIEKELLLRTVPATRLFDVYWRPAERILLFSSTAAAAEQLFRVLFRETFATAAEPADPGRVALERAAPEATRERLLRLTPLFFGAGGGAPDPSRAAVARRAQGGRSRTPRSSAAESEEES